MSPCAAGLLALASLAGELVVVESAPADAAQLAREFDAGWELPARPADAPGLLPSLERLAALRFEVELEGQRLTALGDLVRAVDPLGPADRGAWLDRLLKRAPQLGEHDETLRQLLLDDELRREKWNADRDGDRDGFLMGHGWRPRELEGPWKEAEVEPEIQQTATLLRTDLATFKAVENDFRLYHDHRGANYDFIRPEPGRYFRGEEAAGGPVDTSLIVFRCDLPFPFSNYDCQLHVRNRLDAGGRLACDIYSTSRDFHYMAGRDVCLPVRTGAGEPVGLLLVREFGFDLDGVPDGEKHVRAAMRRALGNLKLEAERRSAGVELGALEGQLPDFTMYGRRD